MPRSPAVLSTLLLALTLGMPRAEEPCSTCKGTGESPCAKHKALNVGDLKVGDFLCADCLDLECCHGIGWTPCAKCKDPKGENAWKADFDRRKRECGRVLSLVEGQWLDAEKLRFVKERRERDARRKGAKQEPVVPRAFLNVLEGPLPDAQVYFLTDMPARRVVLPGQKNPTPMDLHQSHHLYLSRLLEVFHDMEELHRPDALSSYGKKEENDKKPLTPIHPKEMAGIHYTMLLLANEEAQRKLTAKLWEQEAAYPVQGGDLATAWENPARFPQDKDLHQWAFAAIAGGMLHQYNENRPLEERKDDANLPVWLDQGFTHILEIRRWGVCEEAAVNESKKKDPKKKPEPWVPDNWPKAVLGILDNKEKHRPFAELKDLVLDDMKCSDHQLAWSYTDFLLRKGMDKLARLVPLLRKKGTKQAEAIREVYGLTQNQLENEWKAFVLKTYAR